jgi:hypothetical protein
MRIIRVLRADAPCVCPATTPPVALYGLLPLLLPIVMLAWELSVALRLRQRRLRRRSAATFERRALLAPMHAILDRIEALPEQDQLVVAGHLRELYARMTDGVSDCW